MSFTPISPSTPADNSAEPLIDKSELPTIELSFSSGPNGAWDDRELINAANSAMKEFHTHHPGPGSWLDKATAAMAVGKPLPGANDYGTAWYTASTPVVQNPPAAAAPPKKKRKTNTNKTINPYDPAATAYISQTNVSTPISGPSNANARAESPSFQPPSPGGTEDADAKRAEEDAEDAEWGYVEEDWEEEEGDWEGDGQEWEGEAAQGAPQAPPAYGVQSADGVSREEALGHAMTAQYWAGYWMGVAQAKGGESAKPRRRKCKENGSGERELGATSSEQAPPANMIISRHQYDGVNGLKQVKSSPLAKYVCNPLMWGAADCLKVRTSTGEAPKALFMSRIGIENEDAYATPSISAYLEAHVDVFSPHPDGNGEQIKYFLSVIRKKVAIYIAQRNGSRGIARGKVKKELRKGNRFLVTVIEEVLGASSKDFVHIEASVEDEETTTPIFKSSRPSPRSVREDSMLSVDEVKVLLHRPSCEPLI
ncbi:hypothetical protein I350_04900 [Cryptococcus amylolentus CBS 6273]|nr:hypothetical protein I350_04900 [Cryptococcus amylolentus CBS 6273]